MRNWESRFSLFYETKPGNRLNQGFSHAHEGIRGCYEGIKALPTFQPTAHRPSMRGTGEYVKQSGPLLLRILLFFNDAVSLALATCCKNRERLSGSYAMATQSISCALRDIPSSDLHGCARLVNHCYNKASKQPSGTRRRRRAGVGSYRCDSVVGRTPNSRELRGGHQHGWPGWGLVRHRQICCRSASSRSDDQLGRGVEGANAVPGSRI